MAELDWQRTGKITLRCEPYLIIKYPTRYQALYGVPGEREFIGDFESADAAKTACLTHKKKVKNANLRRN
ncbi:MAG: hypothetical protein WAV01_02050 [Candidatus Saccharimonadales bacterium]